MSKMLVIVSQPISLADAQEIVGGFVELLDLGGRQLLINEDGYLLDPKADYNLAATELVRDSDYRMGPNGILGNAILLKGEALWD